MTKNLIIGLGGFGGRIVREMAKEESRNNCCYSVFDTDMNVLHLIEKDDGGCKVHTVPLGHRERIKDYADMYECLGVKDWLPDHPYFTCCTLVNGSAMHRVAARLGFLDAMERGVLDDWFRDTVINPAELHLTDMDRLRVVLVTTLGGGTGSGIFIQLALWIRKKLMRETGMPCIVECVSIMPELIRQVLYPIIMNNPRAMDDMRANAYAAALETEYITNVRMGRDTVIGERITIDGLFDSHAPQDGTPLFDLMHVYAPSAEQDNMDDHIRRIANDLHGCCTAGRSLYGCYKTVRGGEVTADAICDNEEYKEPYRAFERYDVKGITHHLDRRWYGLFSNN